MGIIIYAAWIVAIFGTFILLCVLLMSVLYPILKAKGYDEPIFHDDRVEKQLGELGNRLDFICDVPMHKNKLKKRKVNHGTILAKGVAEKFNIEYLPLCEKVVDNPSQTTLKFSERKKNVKDAYVVNKEFKKQIKGKTILIVDDVITTCATIEELSGILLDAGANKIYALSFAHTNLENQKN